ncbi:hypothetical protein [Insulibacter thermoxylanivorax]|uniref:hypothetical protein n=1 Tax=Insulibacter thermoxylanivorax TaxID=2749268 RepID=UPI001910CC1E|nr:hypothetical protein [Insulibacter thermoxylanivorax]
MRKTLTFATAVLLILGLFLAGCGNQAANQKTAQEILTEAFKKSAEVTSSKYEGSMKLNLQLPDSALDSPEAAMVLNMLNSAELTFRGTSQIDPMMAELFLTARITGDTEIAINMSMLITEEKMWIKIPNTPFLPLPDELVDKYVELDFAELGAMAGEEFTFDPEQQARYQQLGSEIAEIFFGAFEDDQFFTAVSKEDAGLPSDVDADQVVKFELTNENLRPFFEAVIEVLPGMLDKLAEIDEFDLAQAEIDDLKAQLEADKDEIFADWDQVEETLNINDLTVITAVNKEGFVTYTDVKANIDITADGETGTFGFDIKMKQSEINKNPSFEISEPSADDVIPLEDLMNMFMGF